MAGRRSKRARINRARVLRRVRRVQEREPATVKLLGTATVCRAVRVPDGAPASDDTLLDGVFELVVRRKANGHQVGAVKVNWLGQTNESNVVMQVIVSRMNYHL